MKIQTSLNKRGHSAEIIIDMSNDFYKVLNEESYECASPVFDNFLDAEKFIDNQKLNPKEYFTYGLKQFLPENLTHVGFCKENKKEDFSIEELKPIIVFIEENITKIKSFNKKHSSYGLKHILEKRIPNLNRKKYITNGSLIAAMIICGFKYKRKALTPNCFFNISEKSINKII